jgi:hypothetical protein
LHPPTFANNCGWKAVNFTQYGKAVNFYQYGSLNQSEVIPYRQWQSYQETEHTTTHSTRDSQSVNKTQMNLPVPLGDWVHVGQDVERIAQLVAARGWMDNGF